jgi:GxxExxY protein
LGASDLCHERRTFSAGGQEIRRQLGLQILRTRRTARVFGNCTTPELDAEKQPVLAQVSRRCDSCFTGGMLMTGDPLEDLTEQIIGCAIEVHRELGPGLLESIYQECLTMELERARLSFEEERPVAVIYKGRTLAQRFRLDLVVEHKVVVEIKAIDNVHPAHLAQVVSCLKLTGYPAGLLLNFNKPTLREGMKRLSHPELYKRDCRRQGVQE